MNKNSIVFEIGDWVLDGEEISCQIIGIKRIRNDSGDDNYDWLYIAEYEDGSYRDGSFEDFELKSKANTEGDNR